MLTSRIHPTELKNAVSMAYSVADSTSSLRQKDIVPIIKASARAGQAWARKFLGETTKLGGAYNLTIGTYNATEDMLNLFDHLKATKKEQQYIANTLSHGQSVRPIHGHSRTIARTVAMNTYSKAALMEMLGDDVKQARRMEINDDRTSKMCRALNGTIHGVELLVSYQEPLTNDSHPNCRGTFVPHFGVGVNRPPHRNKNFGKFKNAPVEHEPWLKLLKVPYKKVEFKQLPGDITARENNGTLEVDMMDDSDPREIIIEQIAKKIYPGIRNKFKLIIELRDSGMVKPYAHVKDEWQYFLRLYRAWRLKHLDDPFVEEFFRTYAK